MLFTAAVLLPVVAGILVLCKKPGERVMKSYSLLAVLITDLLATAAALRGGDMTLLRLLPGVSLRFAVDGLSRVALTAVLLLYTLVLVYAFVYMEEQERKPLFYGFYLISFGAMAAVCFSGNLVTLYLFFELATLSSVPLVLHDMSREAVLAGLKYLFYSMAGALLGLFAVFFVTFYATGESFVPGGVLDMARAAGKEPLLRAAVFVGIVGFGTKAGLYPMHGWLPSAHPIAPAPASALLSGIIAKAGVVAVIRLVYYAAGTELIAGTWVQTAWLILAMLTILMGSTMAFREKLLKKRLAYSTISQISYIMVGLACLSPEGLKGGLLQLLAHAPAKGCLFLAAGAFIHQLGLKRTDELKGVGKRMPFTLACFTLASLSLIGIPPMGGFLSKWVVANAAIGNGLGLLSLLPPVVLILSALLTAGYLLPVVVDGFFPGKAEGERAEAPAAKADAPLMSFAMAGLCLAALLVGLFGGSFLSALGF